VKKVDLRIKLYNAQSGGPKISILDGNIILGQIYVRAEPKEMIYWSFNDGQTLAEMPKRDGIQLYP